MATEKIEITDEWTPISLAGQSGTCWFRNFPKGTIAIDHSDSGEGGLDIDKSYYHKKSKTEIIDLTADNVDDIFYAICLNSDETAELIADMV